MNPLTVIHLSALVGTLIPIPFGSLLLPYIYWRIRRKKENDLFSIQARNILNFQALFCILFYVSLVILWYVFLQNIWNGTLPNYAMMAYPCCSLIGGKYCISYIYCMPQQYTKKVLPYYSLIF